MATTYTTFTTETPKRITSTYYHILSSKGDRVYNLTFEPVFKRWGCDCPDRRHNGNDRCKHVRRLVEWIAEQEQASMVQSQATAIMEAAEQPIIETSIESLVFGLEHRIAAMTEQIADLKVQLAEQDAMIAAIQEGKTAKAIESLKEALIAAIKARPAPAAKAEQEARPTRKSTDQLEWEMYEKLLEADPEKARREGIAGVRAALDAERREKAALNGDHSFSMMKK